MSNLYLLVCEHQLGGPSKVFISPHKALDFMKRDTENWFLTVKPVSKEDFKKVLKKEINDKGGKVL